MTAFGQPPGGGGFGPPPGGSSPGGAFGPPGGGGFGQPPGGGFGPPGGGFGPPMGAPAPGPSGMAIASLVLAIVSLMMGCGPITAIPGLIIGKIELGKIERGESPQAGKVLAQIGFWMNVGISLLYLVGICLYVVFVVLIIGGTAASSSY